VFFLHRNKNKKMERRRKNKSILTEQLNKRSICENYLK